MMAETQDAAAGTVGGRGRQPGRAKPGAFRVLLWKEWRQQRWTLLGMTALALGLFVLGGFLGKRWSFGLSGAAYVFVLLGLPLVLSGRAFAGEDEDGTAAFLLELPFGAGAVFSAKFLVVVVASWAATGLLLLLGLLWPGYPDNAMIAAARVPHTTSVNLALAVGVALWLVAPVASSLASLLASLGLRSLTTALLSGGGLCLCAYLGSVSVYFLDLLQIRWSVWVLLTLVVPGLVVLLAVGLSARRHPRRLVQSVRAAAGCTAGAILFLVPGALSVLYLMVLATPAAYMCPAWWRDCLGRVSTSVPPTDRPAAVLLGCDLRRDGATSLARLDVTTGRAVWTDTRWIQLHFSGLGAAWSPDGSRMAWSHGNAAGLAGPIGWLNGGGSQFRRRGQAQEEAPPELFVYDVRSQRTARIPGELLVHMLGQSTTPWYDSRWMAGSKIGPPPGPHISFANTEDGSTHHCTVRSGGTSGLWEQQGGTVVVPGRAVVAAFRQRPQAGPAGDAAGELLVAWCKPTDLAADSVLVRDPPPPGAKLNAVSQDAKWALFVTSDRENRSERLDLVDLGSGATRPLALPLEVTKRLAEMRSRLHILGFVTGGTRLLVEPYGIYAVYDLSRDAWQVHAPPPPECKVAYSTKESVSPDGERVLQRCSPSDSSAPMARILDVSSGRWTILPWRTGYGDVMWYGNEHVLKVSDTGLCRYGLDGSREVLYP